MKYTHSRMANYSAGQIIIREGEVADDVYIIRKGQVEVLKRDQFGNDLKLETLSVGKVFGEMDFILEAPRNHSVKAVTDLEVEIVDPRVFSELYDLDIGSMIRPIIQTMAEKLRSQAIRIVELETRDEPPFVSLMPEISGQYVVLTPETKKALQALDGQKQVEVKDFPLYVGRYSRRRSDDMFHSNNLFIFDEMPFSVSRSHFSIVIIGGEFFYYDRGSTLGSFVNGTQIGGDPEAPKKIRLNPGKNKLVLGLENSPLAFTLTVIGG